MNVFVHPPELRGDTVQFAWSQSSPNPFQHHNAFFLRYEGLDVSCFAQTLWLEIWFALLSRVLLAYGEEVTVHLPSPIPAASVAYWLARRGAPEGRIQVVPTTTDLPGRSWRTTPPDMPKRHAGVLYSGGKDSMATLGLAHSLLGSQDTLLVHMVAPLSRGSAMAGRIAARSERLLLQPMATELSVPIQRIWTNYRANLVGRWKSAVKPHLELIVTASLPVVAAHRLQVLTISEQMWTPYVLHKNADGIIDGPGRNTRIESFRLEQRHNARVHGIDCIIANPVFALNGGLNLRLLAGTYPRLLPHVTSCVHMASAEPVCYACGKCLFLGPILLAEGELPDWFDVETLFADDALWQRFTGADPDQQPRDAFGNLPWNGFVHADQFSQLCDAFQRIDLQAVGPGLSPAARQRLIDLKRWFGNAPFPEQQAVQTGIARLQEDLLTTAFSDLAARHFPTMDFTIGPAPHLHDGAFYDFHHRLRPYTADLPHLRD